MPVINHTNKCYLMSTFYLLITKDHFNKLNFVSLHWISVYFNEWHVEWHVECRCTCLDEVHWLFFLISLWCSIVVKPLQDVVSFDQNTFICWTFGVENDWINSWYCKINVFPKYLEANFHNFQLKHQILPSMKHQIKLIIIKRLNDQ